MESGHNLPLHEILYTLRVRYFVYAIGYNDDESSQLFMEFTEFN